MLCEGPYSYKQLLEQIAFEWPNIYCWYEVCLKFEERKYQVILVSVYNEVLGVYYVETSSPKKKKKKQMYRNF